MKQTERSLLVDALVLYEAIREVLPEKDREMWDRWKGLTLKLLYPERTQ